MTHEELREKFINALADIYFFEICDNEERKSARKERAEQLKIKQIGINSATYRIMQNFFSKEECKEIKHIARKQAQKEWDEE